MSKSVKFLKLSQLKRIEELRQSRVLILAASNLDMELLPALYSQLTRMGKVEMLDVVIQCRGGIVNAARRIALLLRKFSDRLNFIVPYHCESAGTILALSADEILAGDLAIFSPIDPHLHGGTGDGASSALSCLDIKQFGAMCQEWFGVEEAQANAEQISLLCNSIFPPTLTAFYRSATETQQIAEELLAYQLPEASYDDRARIVNHLMYNYHSHHYAITTEELQQLGLNCVRNNEVEGLAWDISTEIQTSVGGGVRESLEDSWADALLISRESGQVRYNSGNGLMPQWKSVEV